MRAVTPSAVIVVGICLASAPTSAVLSPQSSPLDRVLPARNRFTPLVCCLPEAFWDAGVNIGVEVDVLRLSRQPTPVSLPAMTLREYLDYAVAAEPPYEWREVGGTPVVRPRAAWADPQNILNQRFDGPLELTDVTLGEAVKALCAGRCGASWQERRDRPYRFSAHFEGGTFLEAIEAVMRAHGPVRWEYYHRALATNVAYECLRATPIGTRR